MNRWRKKDNNTFKILAAAAAMEIILDVGMVALGATPAVSKIVRTVWRNIKMIGFGLWY
jgi:hypothetical protein